MERKSLFTHFIESFTQNYFNFSGRARRREYWGFLLFFFLFWAILLFIGLFTLVAHLGGLLYEAGLEKALLSLGGGMLILLVLGLIYLICLPPLWAVQVRRLHDRGMSGWWILCSIVLGLFQGLVEQMSPDSIAYWIISVVYWALELYLFVQMLMDGEVGANKYGEDPKAAERGLL
ncbi:MAG: DUF805 domain-containing protein [Porphyromonas sp.]|nr:DUF805 domain-containing protein [Porphyromonas sp.]